VALGGAQVVAGHSYKEEDANCHV